MEPGAAESFGINVFQQVLASRGMVLMVLLLLIAMSLVCWFIIGVKFWSFRKIRRQTEEFIKAFWHSSNLEEVREASRQLWTACGQDVLGGIHRNEAEPGRTGHDRLSDRAPTTASRISSAPFGGPCRNRRPGLRS